MSNRKYYTIRQVPLVQGYFNANPERILVGVSRPKKPQEGIKSYYRYPCEMLDSDKQIVFTTRESARAAADWLNDHDYDHYVRVTAAANGVPMVSYGKSELHRMARAAA